MQQFLLILSATLTISTVNSMSQYATIAIAIPRIPTFNCLVVPRALATAVLCFIDHRHVEAVLGARYHHEGLLQCIDVGNLVPGSSVQPEGSSEEM
jgi:hypothetical protein